MPLFRSIQALRALAALSVVLFHAVQRAGGGFTVGAAGVDVFFVVSGFIMWSVTDGRPAAPARFMLHRMIRIVPLYWAVTLGMAGLAWVPGVFPNLPVSFAHVVLSLLFVPHVDPAGGAFPLLAAGWTLNDEMLFYGIFAATLKLSRRGRLAVVSGTLLALVAAGVALRPGGALLQSYTDPVLLEFAAGVWLGASRRLQPRWAVAALAVGAGALAVQAGLPDAGPQWRLLAWGVPAWLLVAGGVGLEGAALRWGRAGRGLCNLGSASYGMYLLHGLVVSACYRLLHGAPTAIFLAVCLAGSAAVGVGCFLTLERPLTRALRWLPASSRKGRIRVAVADLY